MNKSIYIYIYLYLNVVRYFFIYLLVFFSIISLFFYLMFINAVSTIQILPMIVDTI